MARGKKKDSNISTEIPPNEQLKRHPDEAYGDSDVPAHQRDDSSHQLERKKKRSTKNRKHGPAAA